jgi:hypothetical protein
MDRLLYVERGAYTRQADHDLGRGLLWLGGAASTPQNALSPERVHRGGPGIWQTFHFAITEDGTVWQCHFGGNDLSGPGSKLGITAFLSTLSGFLSSLALLFGGRMAVG